MSLNKLRNDFSKCLNGSNSGLINNLVDELLKELSIFEASKFISEVFFSEYTIYKADALALFLEKVIRKEPELALINHPDNFLFKLCIVTGSKDLFDCYIEESTAPFLQNQDSDEADIYYTELLDIATKLTDFFFKQYSLCIKGQHYNGAFSNSENYENAVILNRDNYETMELVMTNYNKIVGRRIILEDLEKKLEIL